MPVANSVAAPAPHQIGSIVAGRYRLERELGAGGMGEVFVAVQEPLGRKVALKLMRAGLTGPAAARFEREAKSLAATVHPNIVTIYDFGRTDDGELFMAMELVPGMTLRQHLTRRGPLPPSEALAVVVEICRALEATHRAGIVHRDLKPENVMLVEAPDRAAIAKVLDFGIARLHEAGSDDAPKLTQTGHLVGTPGYMAPETVLEAVFDDPRSDLYAVGVILWELLTNSSLFQAPTPIALVMKHALDPPPTLATTLQRPVHPELEGLLSRLLHKDRHQRFASATDVIAAIARLPEAARTSLTSGRTPIVNIDPSAPTVAGTQAVPTPAGAPPTPPGAVSSRAPTAIDVVAPDMPTLPTPAPAPASIATTIVERPSSNPLMAGVIGALALAVVVLLWIVLRAAPTPTPVHTPPTPTTPTPTPTPTPTTTPPPAAAPVVSDPAGTVSGTELPATPAPQAPPPPPLRPKPTKPTKPTSTSTSKSGSTPHVPDLN